MLYHICNYIVDILILCKNRLYDRFKSDPQEGEK